jgi:alkaline phosphatase
MQTTRNRIGRRAFLGTSSALAAVGGGLEALQAAEKPGNKPRNIIWMVADGMSPSVLPLAEQFSQRVRGKGLLWQALMDRPEVRRGWMDMASLDSLVTDSSSASSSWGSGARIFNGWVNMLPDGTRLTPIAEIARDKRKRVGLVTTATVTHATPAGFAASVKRRDDEHLIAEQYLDRVDVLLGGGRRFFDAAARADKKDLAGAFRAKGYGYATTRAQLQPLRASKMLGLFSGSHMPYTIDQRNDAKIAEITPTLAEMTQAALDSLSQCAQGFLLQVEGGRVDHAAHANDAAGLLWDQLAFDDAIETVLRFAERRPDTLVVVTSDHGNSNPGLIGMGVEYRLSNQCFDRLTQIKASFAAVSPKLAGSAEYSMSAAEKARGGQAPGAARVQEIAEQTFGFTLTPDEVDVLRKCAEGTRRLSVNRQLDSAAGILGQVVGSHTGVFWTGTSHTSDYTLVTALGPGAGHFAGFIRNTEVFPALTALMEAKFRNPSMDQDKAKQYREAAGLARRMRPDWA